MKKKNIYEILNEGLPTMTLDTKSSEYQVGFHENMENTITEIQVEDIPTKKNRLRVKTVTTKKKKMMPSGMPGTTEYNTHFGKEVLRVNKIEGKTSVFGDTIIIQEKYYKGSLLKNLRVEHRNDGKEIQVNGFLYKINKNGNLTKTYVRDKEFAQKVAQKVPIIMEYAKQKGIKIDYSILIKFFAQIYRNLKNSAFKISRKVSLYMNDKFEKMGGFWSRLIYFYPENKEPDLENILGIPGD